MNILLVIIWFSIIGSTFVYLFWDSIKMWYLIKKSPSLNERFPNHASWMPNDKILFIDVEGRERIGLLIAMSHKSIILLNEYHDQVIRPIAFINDNVSVELRKQKEEFKTYHNDILPSLGSNFEVPQQFLLEN